jgi:sirohydrochlorin cobaltochelatase
VRKVIIVVGHGQLPSDLPKEVRERYFRLRANPRKKPDEERLYEELDRTIANWPRNNLNDPYWNSLRKLAELIRIKLHEEYDVVVAFNEFCAPHIENALEDACRKGYDTIVVVPTMLIPGGVHSEEEIPSTIEKISTKYGKRISYVWPFNTEDIAQLVVKHIASYLNTEPLSY